MNTLPDYLTRFFNARLVFLLISELGNVLTFVSIHLQRTRRAWQKKFETYYRFTLRARGFVSARSPKT